MATGPGKYDDACSVAREATNARAVILIVIGGEKGSGFSVQTDDPMILATLPAQLEKMAKGIRADLKKGQQ